MRKIIRKGLEKIIAPFGLKIVLVSDNYSHVDIREHLGEITLQKLQEILAYKIEGDVDFIINMPLDKLKYRKLYKAWQEVLMLYEKDKYQDNVKDRASYQCLHEYFLTEQPKSVAERMGIPLNEANQQQLEYLKGHPLSTVSPYSHNTPKVTLFNEINSMKQEFELYTKKKYKNDGHKVFGPVSEYLLQMEYDRITTT